MLAALAAMTERAMDREVAILAAALTVVDTPMPTEVAAEVI
jgi:hypothetical protein